MPENTPKPDEHGRYRVLDKDTGHKRTIHALELPHGNYEVLKDPASCKRTGTALPPEHGTPPTAAADNDPSASPSPYDDLTVPQLKDEVRKRNEARDEGAPEIEVAAPGNKSELIAALVASDANDA